MRIVVSFFLTLLGISLLAVGCSLSYACFRAPTGIAEWMLLLAGLLIAVAGLLCWLLAALLGISKQLNEIAAIRKELCARN